MEMSEILVENINAMIRFVYILNIICETQNIYEKSLRKFLYAAGYSIGYLLLERDSYQSYIYQTVYTFVVLYIFCMKYRIERSDRIYLLCVLSCIYEVLHVISVTMGAVGAWVIILPTVIKPKITAALISILVKCISVFVILRYVERKKFDISLLYRYKSRIVCFIYFLVVFMKIPFLYTEIRDGFILKVVFLCVICCTAIFLILFQMDRRDAEKEKARIEENNKLLTAKLHKSQEILPAMVQVLSDVTEKNGTEMEEQKAHKLLKEVSTLYGQQLKENGKDDLQLKNFCSTGLTLLDQQLNTYQYEAIEKEVNLDIFVQAPIDDVIKKDGIDQLGLQRAIGDLIRNAFHAVGKAYEKGGHVLVIIGCQYENTLEVAVMDDGIEIPLKVLETFGKRGVTTEGTGNGLADIREFARGAKASIRVDEFEGKADSFTKKISIIFNEQEMCYLNSPRRDQINSSFWNN